MSLNSETIGIFEAITSKHLEEQDSALLAEPFRTTISFRADVMLVAELDELAARLGMNRSAILNLILDSGVKDALSGYLNIAGREQAEAFYQAAADRAAEFQKSKDKEASK